MKHFLTQKISYNGTTVTDIFKRFRFIEQFKRSSKFYFDYYVKDGETPESIAHNQYGSTNWWWIVLIFNEIHHPFFDWVLTHEQIENYAKYQVPNWEEDGASYLAAISTITTENDNRRKIKLLRAEYLDTVIKNLKGF